MYEMYPDTWALAAERQDDPGEKPRRRARREHSVLPDVIAHQLQLGAGPHRSPQPGH